MSIKARLVIAISVLVAAAFILIGSVAVTLTRAQMIERVDQSLLAAPSRVPRFEQGPRGNGGMESRRATATLVYDATGAVRYVERSGFRDNPDPLPAIAPSDLAAGPGHIFTTGAEDNSETRFRVLVRAADSGFYLVVAAPLEDVDATISGLTAIIAGTGLLVLVGVVVIAWVTIRHELRPIDAMIATAGVIASGDLSQRVEQGSAASEVGQLSAALNEMLARIEESFAAQAASERRLRQFVADASHELRTPLTSIRGYAELYRSGAAADPAGLERVMARIESEGARMGRLVEDLLLLARLDQGRPLERAPVDLARIVEEALAAAQAVEPHRPLTSEYPQRATVVGDAGRLRQVIDNLLANARMHTDPYTPVHVSLTTDGACVTLSVHDDGPGIPEEAVEHVFDRFYRVDTSRTRANGGTGLGLSIVASIVAAHGGTVRLDSRVGQGTTVTIALPAHAEGESHPTRTSVSSAPSANDALHAPL
jgi:two-component system, OmpR family, sensor kinase